MNSSTGAPHPTTHDLAVLCAAEIFGSDSVEISGVTHNSLQVESGVLFAALPGAKTHGARFVESVIAQDVAAVLTDSEGWAICGALCEEAGIPVLVVQNPRGQLGAICLTVYGKPPVKLIGITGTNGKTTTAYMVMQGMRSAGIPVGMIGTLATYIGDTQIPSARTTPEAPDLFNLLLRMYQAGVEVVVMEVSSIAIAEHRIDGLFFDVVGFTNLSHDHLDYHGDMETYFQEKCKLFEPARSSQGIVCVGDTWGSRLCGTAQIPIQSVNLIQRGEQVTSDADWVGVRTNAGNLTVLHNGIEEIVFDVESPGLANAWNALLAVAILSAAGWRPQLTAAAIGESSVPGRGELVSSHMGVRIYVDYAHSPDAIEAFLSDLRSRATGRVITVIGAGGDRDASKRTLMGHVSAKLSDVVIITDDNPRSENPAEIRQSLVIGAQADNSAIVEEIGDRRAAISRAVEIAQSGDCIAVLGKGHEDHIDVGGARIPFHDSTVIRELVARA